MWGLGVVPEVLDCVSGWDPSEKFRPKKSKARLVTSHPGTLGAFQTTSRVYTTCPVGPEDLRRVHTRPTWRVNGGQDDDECGRDKDLQTSTVHLGLPF